MNDVDMVFAKSEPDTLAFESVEGPPEQVERLRTNHEMHALPYRRPMHYTRRHMQLLVEHRCELRWTLPGALEHVTYDPLGDQPPAWPGALLEALLAPDLTPWWRANLGATEELLQACARVRARAADSDRDLAGPARAAVLRFEASGSWPWSPAPELENPARWRMVNDPPGHRSVWDLAGRRSSYRGNFTLDSPLLKRLYPALEAPLEELSREQVRLLIAAHKGLPWVLPVALRLIEADPLEPTSRHPAGILIALLNLRLEIVWRSNPELIACLKRVLIELERTAADPDPVRAQGPYALLERLTRLSLYPWEPAPLSQSEDA